MPPSNIKYDNSSKKDCQERCELFYKRIYSEYSKKTHFLDTIQKYDNSSKKDCQERCELFYTEYSKKWVFLDTIQKYK